jgi:NAD-dependent deacetylase
MLQGAIVCVIESNLIFGTGKQYSYIKIEGGKSMSETVKELQDIIDKYDNIVFFGGAGVSTESGIPDFRSVDGLYHQQYDYPPETILSHSFYRAKPEEFYRFYRNKMLFPAAQPNSAHLKLAELEAKGKVRAVITQNIDGLHQAAGSKVVLELHGSVLRNYCEKCHAFYDMPYIMNSTGVPVCTKCGGSVKPDVVLYEEGLDDKTISESIRYIRDAQVLIIGGTSLAVYPAAGLIDYFSGDKLVVINKAPTPRDKSADLLIQEPIGEVFAQIH